MFEKMCKEHKIKHQIYGSKINIKITDGDNSFIHQNRHTLRTDQRNTTKQTYKQNIKEFLK